MTDFWWLASFVCSIITIFGSVIGNGLTIAAFVKFKKFRNSIGSFILNLTVADFLSSVTFVPIYAYNFYHAGKWKLGHNMCYVSNLVSLGFYYISSITIGLISINRSIKITHSIQTYKTIYSRNGVVLMLAISWILSFLAPTLMSMGLMGSFVYDKAKDTCGIDPRESVYFWYCVIAFTLLAVIISYTRIYYTVWKSKKNLREIDALSTKHGKASQHLLKMLLATTAMFLICFTPGLVTIIFFEKETVLRTESARTFIYLIPYFVSFFINPIVYGALNMHYRMAYLQILKGFFGIAHSETEVPEIEIRPQILSSSV